MLPSRLRSTSLPSDSQVTLPSRPYPSRRSSSLISPARSGMYDAGSPPEESLQLTDTWVPPRLLSFLEREPSVFTPWNPLPPEEDGRAAAEAGRGEKIRLGNGPILPFPVEESSRNIAWEVGEGNHLTVLVRCRWCLQGFGPVTSCGRFMPCWSCASQDYVTCCCNLWRCDLD